MAIAPTYIIKNANARNSTPRKSNRIDTNIKTIISKKTACIGLYTEMTKEAHKTIKNFKIESTESPSIEILLIQLKTSK